MDNTQSVTVEDVLSNDIAFETEEERQIAAKLIPIIAAKSNALAEANKARELTRLIDEIKAENSKVINEKIEEFRKQATPPSPDELQKLLDQEYVTVTLKLPSEAPGAMAEYTLQELPVAAERRLLLDLKKQIGPLLKDVAALKWDPGASMMEGIERLLEIAPGAIVALCGCCAVCLDPFGEKKITAEWVERNVSLTRIVMVLHAQISINRYRDFLSLVSRFSPPGMIA